MFYIFSDKRNIYFITFTEYTKRILKMKINLNLPTSKLTW